MDNKEKIAKIINTELTTEELLKYKAYFYWPEKFDESTIPDHIISVRKKVEAIGQDKDK
jgi:hypothetical protein